MIGTLENLNYQIFISDTTSPEKLPPSERAAYLHDLRTHYQIMLWSLIDNIELEATDWG